jgi:drug/metabolite transporter (DMT)-like permease
MDLHRASGRHVRGMVLATTTMLLWGILPLALKGVLPVMDPATITWYRFAVSTLLLGGFLAATGRLPALAGLGGRGWLLLAVATVFLAVNYLAYLVSLDLTTPADAQVMIQAAPLLLALGGIVVFRERFTRMQWTGFAVLVFGLALFSGSQLLAIVRGADRFLLGVAVMAAAALTWAVYGLAQKQLLQSLPSQAIMLCIYAGCTLLFAPLAEPARILNLDLAALGLLLFCALNTVLGYGAFAEALEHWEASRVSAVLALTPLATLALVELGSGSWPDLQPRDLPWTSLAGAGLVVGGSLLTALGTAGWGRSV